MIKENSNEDFSFQIEGKDYIISEKSELQKKDNEKKIHAPSLAIGAIISGICIAVIIFGAENVLDEPQQLIETQLIEEEVKQPQITIETFFDNASPILGNANAPIALIEFGDYQCSFCKRHSDQTNHLIIKNYVETGKVKIMFKDLIVVGEDSANAAHAAHCAKDQGMFWAYHFTLYNNWNGEGTGWITNDNLNRFAEDLELDVNEFSECMSDNRWNDLILASQKDGQALGVGGTPAFFLIGPTDHVSKIDGAQPYSVFVEVFEAELAK